MKFFSVTILAMALMTVACGKPRMKIAGNFPGSQASNVASASTATAAKTDDLQARSDAIQDATFTIMKKLGAAPIEYYPGEFKDGKLADPLNWTVIDPAGGEGFVLLNELLIDDVFHQLVRSVNDLRKAPKDSAKNDDYEFRITKMMKLGDFLHALVKDTAPYNTSYNQGMNEFYNMKWASFCQAWSGNDQSNCSKDDKVRSAQISLHKNNFESLHKLYEKDFNSLRALIADGQDVQATLSARSQSMNAIASED